MIGDSLENGRGSEKISIKYKTWWVTFKKKNQRKEERKKKRKIVHHVHAVVNEGGEVGEGRHIIQTAFLESQKVEKSMNQLATYLGSFIHTQTSIDPAHHNNPYLPILLTINHIHFKSLKSE